ncbi:MAG: hypothetical protein IKF60_09295 [Solobacterium sp.]|nr:hypothetical protein [Solobacterium sp.]MBR3203768.1 hypothetical protein [Solobacterium sp.]
MKQIKMMIASLLCAAAMAIAGCGTDTSAGTAVESALPDASAVTEMVENATGQTMDAIIETTSGAMKELTDKYSDELAAIKDAKELEAKKDEAISLLEKLYNDANTVIDGTTDSDETKKQLQDQLTEVWNNASGVINTAYEEAVKTLG